MTFESDWIHIVIVAILPNKLSKYLTNTPIFMKFLNRSGQ